MAVPVLHSLQLVLLRYCRGNAVVKAALTAAAAQDEVSSNSEAASWLFEQKGKVPCTTPPEHVAVYTAHASI